MTTSSNPSTYSAAERGLHWAMAALLAALAPIGWLMSDADPAGATRSGSRVRTQASGCCSACSSSCGS